MPVLIVTLGASDLKPKSELVNETDRNFRGMSVRPGKPDGDFVFSALNHACKQMWENANRFQQEFFGSLKYPILESLIQDILATSDKIEELVFVVTEQADSEPRSKEDTVSAAPILQKLIERDFSGKIQAFRSFVIPCNPTNNSLLAEHFHNHWRGEDFVYEGKTVIVSTQGGTAPLKLNFLLKCFSMYPDLKMLTKTENRPPYPDALPEHFRSSYQKFQVEQALKSYRYSDIAAIKLKPELRYLADFAYACLARDLKRARLSLNELRKIQSANSFYDTLYDYSTALARKQEIQILTSFHAARISYIQGDYMAYLIRLFAMSESIAKPAAEAIIGVETTFGDRDSYAEWKVAVEALPELLRVCRASTRFRNGVKVSSPTFHTFIEIFKWRKEEFGEHHPFLNISAQIDTLRDLRNKAAHSTEGVNAEDIEKALFETSGRVAPEISYPNTKDFLDKMKAYFDEVVQPNIYFDVFEKINEKILGLIS